MSEIVNYVERLCGEYPKQRLSGELMWLTLRRFEKASLGADAAYEALKQLSNDAKAKLGEALRSFLDDQPDALKDGYGSLHSVSSGSGVLDGAAFFERIIPPEWLSLIARLQEGLETSGTADGAHVIGGRSVVYKPGVNGLEAGPGESVLFGKMVAGNDGEDE
jgi:hypothetical protein